MIKYIVCTSSGTNIGSMAVIVVVTSGSIVYLLEPLFAIIGTGQSLLGMLSTVMELPFRLQVFNSY